MILDILDDMGIALNTWLDLKMIHSLILTQESNLIIEPPHTRYRFNNTTNMLEITFGKIIEDDFVNVLGETSNYTPQSYIAFDAIQGIVCSNYFGIMGTSYRKPFLGKTKL